MVEGDSDVEESNLLFSLSTLMYRNVYAGKGEGDSDVNYDAKLALH